MFYFSVVIRCHPRFYRTLQLLPLRQVVTMSSRCESVESVHLVREVLWDAMRTRHDWLGIFLALVQDYLSENFSWEHLF